LRARLLGKDEGILGNMRHTAGQIGLSAGDDEMIARIEDPGREDDIVEIHLIPYPLGKLRIRFEQRRMAGPEHLPRLLRVKQRPVSAIDADDLLALDAVPQAQPAFLSRHFGKDWRRSAANPRARRRSRMRADAGFDMRLPM